MKRFIFFAAVLVGLAGCATVMGKKVDTTVAFQGGGTKSFTFAKQVGSTLITEREIQQAFVSAFKSASLYKLVHTYRYDSGGTRYRGVQVKQVANGIEVAHLDNYESLVDSRKATYALSISETPSSYRVQMACPAEYNDFGTFRGGALETKSYISAEQAIENFVAICTNAKPTVKKVEYVKGEINSRFSSDDVFANFSRLLREKSRYSSAEVKAFDIEKASIFELSTGQLDTTLALSVFPYRGGSKTIYSFKYPFTADYQGLTTYDQNVVRRAKQRIEAIAND